MGKGKRPRSAKGSGNTGTSEQSQSTLSLTGKRCLPTIATGHEPKVDAAVMLLRPLRTKGAVTLRVVDPRLPKKKRIASPILTITTSELLGLGSGFLLVSMPGYGCEVLDTSKRITPIHLYRVGVSMKLATALALVLNQMYGVQNGT